MKKKLLIVLLALFIIAVLICISPLVDYLYFNASEPDVSASLPAQSTAETLPTAESSSGESYVRERAGNAAIIGAAVLACGTVIISVSVFVKKRTPES